MAQNVKLKNDYNYQHVFFLLYADLKRTEIISVLKS